MSAHRYKIEYGGTGAIKQVLELRNDAGTLLETAILHNPGDSDWSTFIASLVHCDTTIGNEIESVCLCDDVNDDGSTIVEFIRIISIDVSGGIASTVGDFTPDYSSTYTTLGTVSTCGSIGSPVVGLNQGRDLLNSNTGDVWTRPSALVQSVSVKAVTILDAGNPPTITDYRNITSDLVAGDFEDWECQVDDGANVLAGTFTINISSGDVVVVIWTELTT